MYDDDYLGISVAGVKRMENIWKPLQLSTMRRTQSVPTSQNNNKLNFWLYKFCLLQIPDAWIPFYIINSLFE